MQLLYKCRPWVSAELLILTVLKGGHKTLSDSLDCYQRGWLKFLQDSDMQFWDAWWIWVHFTKAWFSLSQVVVGTSQICQSKTNWESFFPSYCDGIDKHSTSACLYFFFSIHCEFTSLRVFLLACCWKLWLPRWQTGNRSAQGKLGNGGSWEWVRCSLS